MLHRQTAGGNHAFDVLERLAHLAIEIRRDFSIAPHGPLPRNVEEVIRHHTGAVGAGDSGARRRDSLNIGAWQQGRRRGQYCATNPESVQDGYSGDGWMEGLSIARLAASAACDAS
jgi:hypothetical protein